MSLGNAKRPLLDIAGAAAYLATSERHVRVLWQKRAIAGIKLGHLVRFDPADLDAYVDARRVEAVER